MSDHLKLLLTELERFGETNDQLVADRRRRMLNITRDTGEFLAVLVRAIRARFTLEIGTSNGYSTLWLAEAARTIGGHVTTVEASEFKTQLAARTFARSGLANLITQMQGKASQMLAETPDESFDFIFLDAERPEYSALWPDLRRVLRPGRLLVVDNATSHREELAAFVDLVQADPSFTTSVVPVGKGEFLALKVWS
jgi:predicted O-methyltransferase YrrM